MPILIYLEGEHRLGAIRSRLETTVWEGLVGTIQSLFIQVDAEESRLARDGVLEQLHIVKNQVVQFLLDYGQNPYLRKVIKPFHERVQWFEQLLRWLRNLWCNRMERLNQVQDNFPVNFCLRIEERLLEIAEAINCHLPGLFLSTQFNFHSLKEAIREAEEAQPFPLETEANYARILAQVFAQLELSRPLDQWPRKELVDYVKKFVHCGEAYIHQSLECIKEEYKGDLSKYTAWRYISEAREQAHNFNLNYRILT